MSQISNKLKGLLDKELTNIRDDLLELCECKGLDFKREIQLYFKNL